MGIFKVKGSSRAERKAVYNPFTMSRRLSKIAEEQDDASSSSSELSQGNTNANKNNTSGRRSSRPGRHRFQKLVEWDYGNNGSNDLEHYQPPQDFLQVQKKRGNLFFQKGPEPSTMVEVNESTTRKDLRDTSIDSSSTTSPPADAESSMLKIFQFAADTASLSKSCSSELSVCSSYASSKRSFRASFDDENNTNTNNGDTEPTAATATGTTSSSGGGGPLFKSTLEGSFASAPEFSAFQTKNSHENVAQSTTFPVTRGTRIQNASQKPAKIAKLDGSQVVEKESISFSKNEFQLGMDNDFEPFVCDFPQAVSSPAQNAFDGVEWPTDSSFEPQGFEATEKHTDAFNDGEVNVQNWPTDTSFDVQDARGQEEIFQEKTAQEIRSRRPIENQSSQENSSFTKTEDLFQRSENLFRQNKSLFQETENRAKEDDNQENGPGKNANNNMGPPCPQQPTSQAEQMKSPLKENESKGSTFPNSVFRNKKVQFVDNERPLQSSPLMKIPANFEKHGRSRTLANNNAGKKPDEWDAKGRKTESSSRNLSSSREMESRPHVSFRFEHSNEPERLSNRGYSGDSRNMKPIDTGAQGVYRAPSALRHHATANLGALPMKMMSSNSLHLFYDKTNSYDDSLNKKDSFATTINSCDSDSTASSASTFVDASPTGIRGSFPNHLAATFSSMSSSTGSTNLLNAVDSYTRASAIAPTSGSARRPPTGVPPTSIIGSMLFQAGEQEEAPVVTTRSLSPKRERVRGVPKAIKDADDAAISDVTGSTAASDWRVQGNKLLNRYYYNSHDGVSQKKHRLSRQLRTREENNLDEFQSMVHGIQQERHMQAHRRQFNGFVSEFDDRNHPGDKMRRHQDKFQYPTPSRNTRSGFDNLVDDDANSLFEA